MIPMSEAPKDGRSIILYYRVRHFTGIGKWEYDGHKWEQFRFIDGGWEAWNGNWRTRCTHRIDEKDAEGWMPNPMDNADYFVTEFYYRQADKEVTLIRVAINSYPEWVMSLWTKLQPQGTS